MAENWYYVKNDQQMGPVPREKLVQLLGSGGIARDDLVWTDTMTDWKPASQVAGLMSAVQAAARGPAGTPVPQARPAQARPAQAPAGAPVARTAGVSPASPTREPDSHEEPDAAGGWAGMSPGLKAGIIAGASGGVLFLLLAIVILFQMSGGTPSDTGQDKTQPFTQKKPKKEPTPQEEIRDVAFDPSSISDAKEQEWYDTGKKVGMREVDQYVEGFQSGRPPDDKIVKKVKEMLKERDVAVHVACRNGERDRPAMLAFGRRDGVKAGIAKHKLPGG